MHDPNELAPNGHTYAEIDARESDSVRRANEALEACQHLDARWWGYSVSHCTFDLIIGDPLGREDNLAICCPSTTNICGPISWRNQQLRVEWTCDRASRDVWHYRLIDENVGFRLETGMFLWRQNFDIHANDSIWFSARAPLQKHLEYLCPKCNHASYGHHPFCAECGSKLPSESKMFAIGLTRPIINPSNILQMGYNELYAETESGTQNSDRNQ